MITPVQIVKYPPLIHSILIIAGTLIWGTFQLTDRGPVEDETLYLEHAYSLYKFGIFGQAKNADSKPEANARIAPVLPVFIAGVMSLNKDLALNVECSVTGTKNMRCNRDFSFLKQVELLLASVCIALVWLLMVKISKSVAFSYTTVFFILLSGIPFYFADHFLTESIYLPVACIFMLCLAIAMTEKNKHFLLASSVLLAILALTRPTFYYLFFLLLPFIAFSVFYYGKNTSLAGNVVFLLCLLVPFSLITTPWLIRNYNLYGKPAITAGYGAMALSSRVSYNDMTDREYLAGWVYWLPDFGDSLARDIFGKESIKRLDFGDPEGFILHERGIIRKQINQARMVSARTDTGKNNFSPEYWLIDKYILNDLVDHIKVTFLLAWRGVFIEKYFGLIGLLFMIWGLINGLRKHTGPCYYWIVLPPALLLFFHAFLSVSIPRYNIPLVLPMSIAMAAGCFKIFSRLKSRRLYNQAGEQ